MNLASFWIDLKFAFRLLKRFPGITAFSVAAIAIGIGLVAVMSTIVDGVLLSGPRFPGGHDLKFMEWYAPKTNLRSAIRIQDFEDIRQQQTSFPDLAFWVYSGDTILHQNNSHAWQSAQVSANWLDILGVQPALGRGFLPGEDTPGADPVVLLGQRVWLEQFNGDPSIVGQSILVSGKAHTVVGVMPPDFRFPVLHDLWMPFQGERYSEKRQDAQITWVFGFLKKGVSHPKAQAELDDIARRLEEAYPESNKGYSHIWLQDFTHQYMDQSEELIWAMVASVFLVLIIACANVANLLLSKSAARTTELAIRRAIGASRGRIVAQVLTETLFLTLLGGALGFVFTIHGVDASVRQLSENPMPYWFQVEVSWKTVLYIIILVAFAALVAGFYPAWSASRVEIKTILNDPGRTSGAAGHIGRLNQSLIVFQIALSLAALIGAFSMLQVTRDLAGQQMPFDPTTVLQAQFNLSEKQFPEEAGVRDYLRRLTDKIKQQPGVEAAGITSAYGMVFPWNSRIALQGKDYPTPNDYEIVEHEIVSWDYFRILGIPLVKGRDFQESDGESNEEAVIINKAFADKFWPGEDPLEKRFRNTWKSHYPWYPIIGVVANADTSAYGRGPGIPHFYQVSNQATVRNGTLFIRFAGDPASFIPVLQQVARDVNPEVVLEDPMTVADRMRQNQGGLDYVTQSFSFAGGISLLLAGIGIYGVLSFAAGQRTREFGIRLALGAKGSHIVRSVLSRCAWQLVVGLLLGFLIGWGLLKGIGANLPMVKVFDPLTYFLPTLLIAVVAFASALPPIYRATRLNPSDAIRDL